MENTHTILEHGEIELVPTWNQQPYVLVPLTWEGTMQATGRDIWKSTQPQNL